MKTFILLATLLFQVPLLAQPLLLDLHVIEADVFYPQDESAIAGTIVANRIILESDVLSLLVDENKEIFDATLAFKDNTLMLDTRFATISTDIAGIKSLFEPIEKLKAQNTHFIYNNNKIYAATEAMELIYDDVDFKAWNTIIDCQNYSNKKSITKQNAFVDCLNNSIITPREEVEIATIEANYDDIDLYAELTAAQLEETSFQLQSIVVGITSKEYAFRFNDLNAFCIKTPEMKSLVPKAYIDGCLQESYLELSSLSMNSKNVELKSDIDLLNIGGPRLRLSSPLISIKTNKDQTTIKKVRAACHKNISSIDDINLDTFVTGCLENSIFNVEGITSESFDRKNKAQQEMVAEGSKKEVKKAKKESKGFSIDDFSQLELTSKNSNVTLLGKVKLLFLYPEFQINAKASYQDSTLHFDVEQALIAGFIPVKKLLLYLLGKFIPEGNISVNENIISIKIK